MIPDIVEYENISFAWVKPSKQFIQKKRERDAVLSNIEIVIESMRASQSSKDS